MRLLYATFNLLVLATSFNFVTATPHPHGDPIAVDTNSTSCARSAPDLTNCSPDQCPHKYTFEEFHPNCSAAGVGQSNEQPYFRFLILFKMNKALCEEQAHEHWKTVHADLTLASKGTGVDIIRYVQFHADTAHKKAIQSLVDTGMVDMAPYDGIAEFHTKDSASILRFINNAFGNPTIVKDQQYFVDTGMTLHVMAGYDTLIYGSGIETSNGTDGIMPADPRFNN